MKCSTRFISTERHNAEATFKVNDSDGNTLYVCDDCMLDIASEMADYAEKGDTVSIEKV